MKFVLALLLSMGSAASAQSFICQLKGTSEGGFVPDFVAFTIGEGGASALVSDPIIQNVVEKPMQARTRKTNAGAIAMRWAFDVPTTSKSTVRVNYRAVFDPKTQRVSYRASISGGVQSENGRGACQKGNF